MSNDDILHISEPDDTPGRSDARRNRALLLETAARLFDAQGVDAVSMTAIADEAAVGKGTLYRHFPNKAAVCNALLDEDMRLLQTDVLAHMREDGEPLHKLQWFLERVYQFVTRNEALLLVETDGRGLELDHPAHFWWRQTIAGLLGQLLPREDVRYETDVLYVMLDVRTLHFQRHVVGYDDATILSGLRRTAALLCAT
jgi:AcrR family transcriptional regulator